MLIDRDSLLTKFESGALLFQPDVRKVIESEPEAIVRCKNCKHRDPEDKKCDCGHGIIWQLPMDDNWFCADGERRTDE